MQTPRKSTEKKLENPPACRWSESSTRWMLENYDIWSATPPRGCQHPTALRGCD